MAKTVSAMVLSCSAILVGRLLATDGVVRAARVATRVLVAVAVRWRFGARILIFCRTAADAGRREAVARRFPQKDASAYVRRRHAA